MAKRIRNNNANNANNSNVQELKSQRIYPSNNETEATKLIITDFNPFNVRENKDDKFRVITEFINTARLSRDKHFFHPSSFIYNNKDEPIFEPALCIHKFIHNGENYPGIKTPVSYLLHPIIRNILESESRQLSMTAIETEFRKLAPGQTLWIKLENPITLEELDGLKRGYGISILGAEHMPDGFNYSKRRETPIILNDNSSVIKILQPETTIGNNLPEPIPMEGEVEEANSNSEYNYGIPATAFGTGSNVWTQGMMTPATQPASVVGGSRMKRKITKKNNTKRNKKTKKNKKNKNTIR